MNINLKKLQDCKRLLEIELSVEEIASYFEFAYKELGKETEVPGFRRGKVPFDILKERFSAAAAKRAFENIILNVYTAAVREKSIVPITDPAIDTAGKMPCEGEGFRFKATVEVWPEVKIDNYKGIVVEKEDFKISEEDVDAVLEMEQQKNGELFRGFDSLSELRRDIQRRLGERAEKEVQIRAESRLMDELVKKAEIEALPASLIEGQLNHLMFISQIGAESSGDKKDSEELKQRFRPMAEQQVKTVLILDEIVRRENIAVSDEALEKELAKKKKKTEEERENSRSILRRRNAINFLMEHAEIRKKEISSIVTPDQASSTVPEKQAGNSQKVSPGGIIIP